MRLIVFIIVIALSGICHAQAEKQKVVTADPEMSRSGSTPVSTAKDQRPERIIITSDTAQLFKYMSRPDAKPSSGESRQKASPAAETKKNSVSGKKNEQMDKSKDHDE